MGINKTGKGIDDEINRALELTLRIQDLGESMRNVRNVGILYDWHNAAYSEKELEAIRSNVRESKGALMFIEFTDNERSRKAFADLGKTSEDELTGLAKEYISEEFALSIAGKILSLRRMAVEEGVRVRLVPTMSTSSVGSVPFMLKMSRMSQEIMGAELKRILKKPVFGRSEKSIVNIVSSSLAYAYIGQKVEYQREVKSVGTITSETKRNGWARGVILNFGASHAASVEGMVSAALLPFRNRVIVSQLSDKSHVDSGASAFAQRSLVARLEDSHRDILSQSVLYSIVDGSKELAGYFRGILGEDGNARWISLFPFANLASACMRTRLSLHKDAEIEAETSLLLLEMSGKQRSITYGEMVDSASAILKKVDCAKNSDRSRGQYAEFLDVVRAHL